MGGTEPNLTEEQRDRIARVADSILAEAERRENVRRTAEAVARAAEARANAPSRAELRRLEARVRETEAELSALRAEAEEAPTPEELWELLADDLLRMQDYDIRNEADREHVRAELRAAQPPGREDEVDRLIAYALELAAYEDAADDDG